MKTKFKVMVSSVLAMSLTSAAFGATTGSITIQGTVAGATAISVTPTAGYNNLDLSASPVDQEVAQVREVNNTTTGYRVTLTSSNAGQLKFGTSGTLAYTAKYNGTTVTLSATPQTITNVGTSTGVVNTVKPFAVSYSGLPADQMLAGTYSDTLTFTITAN